MSQETQTLREIIKEQAEAETYAPMGEKPKPKENSEEIEAELQEFLAGRLPSN